MSIRHVWPGSARSPQDVFTVIWVLRAMKVSRLRGGLGLGGEGRGIKAPARLHSGFIFIIISIKK